MIPHATTNLKEDSSEDFLGTETPGSRTDIKKKEQQQLWWLNRSGWISR